MSITNLTDLELEHFLQSPNEFLSNPENARRVLGLTPASLSGIKENLHRQGFSEKQINDRLGAVMSIKELISSIVKKLRPEDMGNLGQFQRKTP